MNLQKWIQQLGYQLPPRADTKFSYTPLSIHAGVARVAGQIAKVNSDTPRSTGAVGSKVSIEQAADDARLCVLHGLRQLHDTLNGLDLVERPLFLTIYVASDSEDYLSISKVADGASKLLIDIFGPELGEHPRSVVAVTHLPRNAPVMVEATYAIKQDH